MFDWLFSSFVEVMRWFYVRVLSIRIGPMSLIYWIIGFVLVGGIVSLIFSIASRAKAPGAPHLRRVRGGDLENG